MDKKVTRTFRGTWCIDGSAFASRDVYDAARHGQFRLVVDHNDADEVSEFRETGDWLKMTDWNGIEKMMQQGAWERPGGWEWQCPPEPLTTEVPCKRSRAPPHPPPTPFGPKPPPKTMAPRVSGAPGCQPDAPIVRLPPPPSLHCLGGARAARGARGAGSLKREASSAPPARAVRRRAGPTRGPRGVGGGLCACCPPPERGRTASRRAAVVVRDFARGRACAQHPLRPRGALPLGGGGGGRRGRGTARAEEAEGLQQRARAGHGARARAQTHAHAGTEGPRAAPHGRLWVLCQAAASVAEAAVTSCPEVHLAIEAVTAAERAIARLVELRENVGSIFRVHAARALAAATVRRERAMEEAFKAAELGELDITPPPVVVRGPAPPARPACFGTNHRPGPVPPQVGEPPSVAALTDVLTMKVKNMPFGSIAALSDDLIAFCAFASSSVHVLNSATGALACEMKGHTSDVMVLEALDDGRLASSGDDKTVRVWDVRSGACALVMEGHEEYVCALAALPGGRLASAGYEHKVFVWDTAAGACALELVVRSAWVRALAALPGGRLATAGGDETVCVWDLATGTCSRALQGHTAPARALASLPGGRLASAGEDGTVRVWDIDTGACERIMEGNSDALVAMPDGRLASIDDGKTVRVRDAATGACEAASDFKCVYALAATPNGRLAAASYTSVKIFAPGRSQS